MSDNPRDRQFQGFAYAVFEEMEEYLDAQNLPSNLPALYVSQKNALRVILARRAYDLVDMGICYIAMDMSNDSAVMFVPRQDAVKFIPDMTKLPKEQNE